MKFHVERTFQFAGRIIREGNEIEVTKEVVEKEVARGRHKTLPVFLSGLLNYCTPADEETARFLSKATGKQFGVAQEDEEEKESPDEITLLRREFEEIGAAYDRRWNKAKLRNELLKAKKLRGA